MKVLLCDIDGTLIDSYGHILESVQRTFTAMGVEYINLKEDLSSLGINKVLEKAKISEEDFFSGPKNVYLHRPHITETITQGLVFPYAGAKNFLEEVKKLAYTTVLVTSGDYGETKEKLKLLDINWEDMLAGKAIVAGAVCAEMGEKTKPAPEPALKALTIINAGKKDTLYLLGDEASDSLCAENLKELGYKVTSISVNENSKADYVARTFKEVINILRS